MHANRYKGSYSHGLLSALWALSSKLDRIGALTDTDGTEVEGLTRSQDNC